MKADTTITKTNGEEKLSPNLSIKSAMGKSPLLSQIQPMVLRKAFLIVSHLLLSPGARVAILGSKNAALAFAMAQFNPRLKFTAYDYDSKTAAQAGEKYACANLRFEKGDVSSLREVNEPYDAIINVDLLHELYSIGKYNPAIVDKVLEAQYTALKPGGQMIVYDYLSPTNGEDFVLLEIPEKGSDDNDIAEKLLWFADNARPLHPQGCRGFFIEELAPRFPHTRLFRLPHKWACEFVLRKDWNNIWQAKLSKELTFFEEKDFRQSFKSLGARIVYSAPQWNHKRIKNCFQGHFRLLDQAGKPLGFPATGFILVAKKIEQRQPVVVQERRQIKEPEKPFSILPMRAEGTGFIHDVVMLHEHRSEILPYYINDQGRLMIVLSSEESKALINTVSRYGYNVEGRRWSGFIPSALTLDRECASALFQGRDVRETLKTAKTEWGFMPKLGTVLEEGPKSYPAPTYIEDRIESYFLPIQKESVKKEGSLIIYDAEDVLRAIHAGFIPNTRLSHQINILSENLNIQLKDIIGAEAPPVPPAQAVEDVLYTEEEIEELRHSKKERYKKARAAAGQIRQFSSHFAQETPESGGLVGLSSQEKSYVIHDGQSINRAVIMPLTRNLSGDVLAGFEMDDVPVPDFYGQSGKMLSLPSFVIPPEFKTIEEIRRMIAEKFDTSMDMVTQIGPSFYEHIDMTPQRLFPFAVGMKPGGKAWTKGHYAPISKLCYITKLDSTDSFLWIYGFVHKLMGSESDLYSCYNDMDRHNVYKSSSQSNDNGGYRHKAL